MVVTWAVLGPSSTGKTTAVNGLAMMIPGSKVIHLDDYYLPDAKIPVDGDTGYENWDCAEAIDWAQFDTAVAAGDGKQPTGPNPFLDHQQAQLRAAVGDVRDVIFVEGFLLYRRGEHYDGKLFVYAGYDTIKLRRANRVYPTENGDWTDPPGYFDGVVWKEYCKNYNFLFEDPPTMEQVNQLVTQSNGITCYDCTSHSEFDVAMWIMQQLKPT